MIGYYRQLWATKGQSYPNLFVSLCLLSLSVGVPILMSMLLFKPVVSLIGLGSILAIVAVTLFFNVKHFIIYVFPLIYAYTEHRFILILCVLLLISFLAGKLQAGQISLKIAYPVLLAVLFVSGLMGITRAYDIDDGRYFFQYTLFLPIIVFLVYYNLNPSTRMIAKNLTVLCFVAAIIGWSSLGRYFVVGYTRYIIGWASFNPAACFFGMMLPFAIISLLYEKEKMNRVLWWFIISGIFAGIFVTQSRAAYLTFVIIMAYIAWKDKRVMRIMMPIIFVGVLAVPSLILYRLSMMFGVGEHPDWSSVGRVQIWANAITLIPKYFLFGMGFDSFRHIYPINFPTGFIRAEHPHNVLLRWLFELGISGLIAYLIILYSAFIRAFKHVKLMQKVSWTSEDRLLMSINAGMVSAILPSLVDSPFHHPQVAIILWIFVAFQLTMTRRMSIQNGE